MKGRLLYEADIMEAFRKAPAQGKLLTPEDIIKNVETGYDVDKVVEQMKDEFLRVNELANNEMTTNGHTLDFENYYGQVKGLKRSTEIVKAGGIQ